MTRLASENPDAPETAPQPAAQPCSKFPAEPARQALITLARRRHLSVTDAARDIHLDQLTARKLFRSRWLPWERADQIAVALGRHPSELWHNWFSPIAEKPDCDLGNTTRRPKPDLSAECMLANQGKVGAGG